MQADNNSKSKKRAEKIINYYKEDLKLEKKWENPSYIYNLRNPSGLYIFQKMQRFVVEMLNKNNLYIADKKILDVGCGYGNWLRFFTEIRGTSKKLTGIDITPHKISKAKELNNGIDFIVGDVINLPFPDNCFDIVTQFFVFEHLLEDTALMKAKKEVLRVLKNEGIFIWYDLLPFPKGNKNINRGYSVNDLKTLFPEFKIVDCKKTFKVFNIFEKRINSAYKLPRYSFALTDLIQKVPFGKSNNMLAVMKKKQ